MKITVNGKRYDLNTMVPLGISSRESHGIQTVEVFFGPRSHRLITETYSIWENRETHGVVGTQYHVLEPNDYEWVSAMQDARNNSRHEHREMLDNAMDEHVPAMEG